MGCLNLKKNKLIIVQDTNEKGEKVYKVQDNRRLFLITSNKDLASRVCKQLKLDYQKQREQENASKI